MSSRYFKVHGAAVFFCALFVSGCYLSKDPATSPSPKVQWQAPAPVNQDQNSASELRQTPYDLGAALDTALENNPSTRAAWLAARAAAAAKKGSYSELYPQVDGSIGFGRTRTEFSGSPIVSQRTATTPGISVQYTLIDFGTRFASIRAAEETLQAANFQFNRALQEMVFEVQRRYFLLHATQAAVLANEETIREARRSLDAAQKSFDIGSKPKQDVLQAEASLRRAEFGRDDAKASVEDARALFAEILGVPVGQSLEISPPDFAALKERSKAGEVQTRIREALLGRPDLQAAYADARRAEARRDIAVGQSLPRIVGRMTGNENYLYGETDSERNYDIGVELQVPIFTGFRDRYRIEQESQLALQAEAQNQAKELSVQREVWSAYFRFDAAFNQTNAARALVSATTESYRAVEQGYRNGANSVLDLLAAQRELSEARRDLIATEADCAISFARLELATGKLPAGPG